MGGVVVSKGATPQVMSMDILAPMATMSRSPTLKPRLVREVPKPKKDKQKKHMPMHESQRKHVATQAQKKEKMSANDKGKVVDLKAEEDVENLNTKGVDPICKLLAYIPMCKGKLKVHKDQDV